MTRPAPRSLRLRLMIAALAAPVALPPFALAQTNGQWTLNNSGSWSTPGNWQDTNIADGIGSIADFSQLNITGNRTVTIDGAIASRTVGTLLIGDTDGTHSYTIGASGGGTLTFANGGSNAVLTQVSTSAANTISAPILLDDHLTVNNASGSNLTLSGAISGSKGVVVQNSGSGALVLSGANNFSGVTIKQGTLITSNNAATALGTGTVLLGDTSGNADATLSLGSATITNNIIVQAGSTGTLTLSNTSAGSSARPTGDILLNNDLTITVEGARSGSNQGALFSASGTISGTGNLNLNVVGGLSTSNNTNQPQMDNLTITGPVTTTGAIHNVGTATGRVAITGNISNAASVNQDSATSMLVLGTANAPATVNTYTGDTNVNAGILRLAVATALPANNTVNVAAGGSFQLSLPNSTVFGAGTTLNLSGHGGTASHGALESTNNASYAGAVVLQSDATVASGLANTTLALSGTITGSGQTLTLAGVGNTAISTDIATGTGGLVKEGTGTATLSAANTYTGTTSINQGVLAVSHADALGGGGAITFNGGALRHASGNTTDYASRIVNSTGPVAIDTAGQNVTYAGNIDATNSGGLSKQGTGRLTLSGTNSFSGPIVVNGGVLAITDTSAIPASGTGQIFIDSAGALNNGGAYATVQEWLDSGNINTASTGAIALTGGTSANIDFTGYNNLSLGASNNSTYTGTLTAANSTYRLGGGGAILSLTGTNALTGANALVVNGAVSLSGANDLTGATTVNSNTLTLGGNAGGLAASDVTVNPGAALAITGGTSGTAVTRAKSVTLNRGTLNVTGNSGANSIETITGGLTIGAGGNSIVTLSPQSSSKNVRLFAGEFSREAGATALIRGTALGVNSLASQTNNSTNIELATPNLVGGILVGVVGDTANNGSGFGATGGLLTYDTTNGVRLLTDYKTSIASVETPLDNVRLSSASGVATTTITSDTTINSLTLQTSGANSASISIGGTGKLTLNSGVIYSNSVTANAGNTIGNTINFNQREGIILVGGTNNLTLSGVLEGTDGNGLTIYAPSRTVTFSGAEANTYTGVTTVNGGMLTLGKTAGVNAIAGDVVVNTGGTLSMSASNQIADTANVTVNGGSFSYRSETINNLTVIGGSANGTAANSIALTLNGDLTVADGGSVTTGVAGPLTVSGVTTLSNGGSLSLGRSQNITGTYDSVATLHGGLNITHTATGAYTAITIGHGAGAGQSGAKLILGGDVTFTGNSTNTNTVFIDAIKGTGRQGVIELTADAPGNRTFNIGDGAAATDLAITAALLDGAGGASGLVKTGAGTLALFGDNTYTGPTTISAGTLALGASHRLADTGQLVMDGGTFATRGFSETLGTLSLTASSTIDLGDGASALFFADSSGVTWGDSLILNFINFTAGLDSIRFGINQDALEASQLAMIRINGFSASIDSDGFLSISVVPEPSAFAAFAGAGALLCALRRRRRAA